MRLFVIVWLLAQKDSSASFLNNIPPPAVKPASRFKPGYLTDWLYGCLGSKKRPLAGKAWFPGSRLVIIKAWVENVELGLPYGRLD